MAADEVVEEDGDEEDAATSQEVKGDISTDAPPKPASSESSNDAASPEAAKELEPPEGLLSFRSHMWDRVDFLWQKRVDPSMKLLEQVIGVLRARAVIERHYAESLVGIPAQVALESQGSSLQSAIGTVLFNFRNRGERSVELADQIDQDIVVTFEEVATQHREVCKKLQADVELLVRYCQDTRKTYVKQASRYGVRCAEAEQAARECLQALGLKAVERTKLAMRVVAMGLQARSAESEYYSSIEQANRARVLCEQQLPHILTAMQEVEERSAHCLRDGLRKLSVYEMSWLRNMQYDLEATVKAAESADPGGDLQDFLRQSWKEHGQLAPSEVQSCMLGCSPFWELGRPRQPRDTPFVQQLRQDDEVIRLLVVELQPLVAKLLHEELVDEKESAESNVVVQLQQGLDDLHRRAALCQVLKQEVLMGVPEGTELDNAKDIRVGLLALEGLALVFCAALDACDAAVDAWFGRDFMVLAQLFRAEVPETGKGTSLFSRIYSHRIWSKVPFWEEVLLVGLCEAHAAEVIWRRSLPAGSLFNTPSMTAFLSRFVGHMLTFGIRLEQARAAVYATLRKNATMLGPANARAYETLLMQTYEVAAAAATMAPTASGAAEPRTMQAVSTAEGGAEPGVLVAAEEEDDDFEAVALGLPPRGADTTPALGAEFNVTAGDTNAAVVQVERTHSDEAMQALAVAQRSVDDVFA